MAFRFTLTRVLPSAAGFLALVAVPAGCSLPDDALEWGRARRRMRSAAGAPRQHVPEGELR